MKQESVTKYILRLAVTLLLITGVVAAALAGVNSITAPKIAKNQQAKVWKAIQTVLPGAIISGEVAFSDTTGLIKMVYKSDIGYAVEVAPVGFGGTITMMVGVSHEGEILGMAVVSQTETAGLGAVVAADSHAGQIFRDQFVGLSGEVAVTKDGGSIDAITGATITSRAVTEGVNAALQCVAQMEHLG